MSLKPGDPAPDFETTSHDGETIRLADYRGRKLVLYFYPMDGTPACTAQACSLRDFNRDIADAGAAILGVSAQKSSSHEKFIEKYQLNFPLLVDTNQAIAKAYGAAGRTALGSVISRMFGVNSRITFIIDESGRIAHVLDDPNCPNHGEEVLRLLKQ